MDSTQVIEHLLASVDMSAFESLLSLLLLVVERCLHQVAQFTNQFFKAYLARMDKPTKLLVELYQNSLEVKKALLDKL